METEQARRRRERLERWRAAKEQETVSDVEGPQKLAVSADLIPHSLQEPKPLAPITEPSTDNSRLSLKPLKRQLKSSNTQPHAISRSKRLRFDVNAPDDAVSLKGPKFTTLEADDERPETLVSPDEQEPENSDIKMNPDTLDHFIAGLKADHSRESIPSIDLSETDDLELDATGSQQDPTALIAELEGRNTKVLPDVDHTAIDYPAFRKKLYMEPISSKMGDGDLAAARKILGLRVKSTDVAPLVDWSHAGLPSRVIGTLEQMSFTKMTPIQSQAIPTIMSGKDVLAIAETGSGKTLAFLMPLLRHVLDQRHRPGDGPIAVVFTPTRELCAQISSTLAPFTDVLGLSVVTAYGGSSIQPQIATMKRGVHIAVCTPGRLIDLLAANGGRVTNLRSTTFVVIDEADRMFDMGFEPQIRKIMQNVRPDRQTVMFSATFSRPMEKLANHILLEPAQVIAGARSTVSANISQSVKVVDQDAKFPEIMEALRSFFSTHAVGKVIIFVEKQDDVDRLARRLIASNYPVSTTHGGRAQELRDKAIQEFKTSGRILVATSLASRGIDIQDVGLVVNYDAPNHMEDYVHRVGRTGRAGSSGSALTLLVPGQGRQAFDIARALRMAKTNVPPEVESLAKQYQALIDSGDVKRSTGFGGHGLARLDNERKQQRNIHLKAAADQQDGPVSDRPADQPLQEGTETNTVAINSTASSAVIQEDVGSNGIIRYSARLDINDYPTNARLAVTSSSDQNRVIEAHAVSITGRGQFTKSGGIPDEKLHLVIEGKTESAVRSAYQELIRLVVQAINASGPQKDGSRYTV